MQLLTYVKESFRELKENMTWISWEEAQKTTAMVALFTVIFALAVFGVDKVFQTFLMQLFQLF